MGTASFIANLVSLWGRQCRFSCGRQALDRTAVAVPGRLLRDRCAGGLPGTVRLNGPASRGRQLGPPSLRSLQRLSLFIQRLSLFKSRLPPLSRCHPRSQKLAVPVPSPFRALNVGRVRLAFGARKPPAGGKAKTARRCEGAVVSASGESLVRFTPLPRPRGWPHHAQQAAGCDRRGKRHEERSQDVDDFLQSDSSRIQLARGNERPPLGLLRAILDELGRQSHGNRRRDCRSSSRKRGPDRLAEQRPQNRCRSGAESERSPNGNPG